MFNHGKEILILTGPPGSGKTTAAVALAQMAGSPKVHLHSDDFWAFIKHGAIAPYLPESHAQNTVVMDALCRTVSAYAEGGYFVVLDGIIGPWFLPVFEGLALTVHYVVLRPPLSVVITRCQQRGGDTLVDPAAIASLHGQFGSLGALERHVLTIGDDSPAQLLERLIDAVDAGACVLPHSLH
ncbi:AAA family ATPase [Achromobacter sp. K91]|uniref:AAA family ATPase n=1 Tax=Achromobacter TaxID=222 RepID=UPI000A8B0FDC|nr:MULTISPECIES: AAA family ATPase [unclassified Achromobacter]MDH1303057.1 AAA family ATPase [Achromobacter sp. GD03932]RIJ00923.1 AAA family ATPase [Achromobacter sp. K91]